MVTRRIESIPSVRARVAELWRGRELVWFFIWRDWKVRYRQTAIGGAWALFQPAILATIFWLFLGRVVQGEEMAVPYVYFAFAGMIPWLMFANGTNKASSSLVEQAELIRKASFPRLALPIAGVGGFALDFLTATVIILVSALFVDTVSFRMLWIPLAGLLAAASSVAVGVGLAAMNVRYRDVRFVTPFLIQTWLFATPVVYPESLIGSGAVSWALSLNPMKGPVTLYQWSVGALGSVDWRQVCLSGASTIVILTISVRYFHRTEDEMADVV